MKLVKTILLQLGTTERAKQITTSLPGSALRVVGVSVIPLTGVTDIATGIVGVGFNGLAESVSIHANVRKRGTKRHPLPLQIPVCQRDVKVFFAGTPTSGSIVRNYTVNIYYETE